MAALDSRAAVVAALGALESAVARLRLDYGETLGVRRLTSDVSRLVGDLDELGDPTPRLGPTAQTELEGIVDVPYDRSMWTDADDEGFGVSDRHVP